MSLQTINLGNYANDGTGDDLRTAFEKVNSNFNNLETVADNIANGVNLGSITLTGCSSANNVITTTSTSGLSIGMSVVITLGTGAFYNSHTVITHINSLTVFTVDVIPLTPLLHATIIATPKGAVFLQRNMTNLDFKTITSTDQTVLITSNSTTVDLASVAKIENDNNPTLTAPLQLNGHYITGGDVQATLYAYNVPMIINLLGLLIKSSSVDFGSILSPTATDMGNIDFGSFTSTVNNNVDFGNF